MAMGRKVRKFFCTDWFGGLTRSLGETVLLSAGCGCVCCENVIWRWSKGLWEHMNKFPRFLKWALYQSYLVKMLAQLIFMATCFIWTVNSSYWNSQKFFLGDWYVQGLLLLLLLLLLLFWTSIIMIGCHCRQQWARRYRSCPDRRLGVWGEWCLWRIHLWP